MSAPYMKVMANERDRWEVAFMDNDGNWYFEPGSPDFGTKREADKQRHEWLLEVNAIDAADRHYRAQCFYAAGERE